MRINLKYFVIAIALVVIVVSALAWKMIFQSSSILPAITESPTPGGWLKFNGSKVEYSFSYPGDWAASEEYTPDGLLDFFSVKKGGYELTYAPPRTLPEVVCVFNDTDKAALRKSLEKDFPDYYDQAVEEFNSYTEFGKYRRAQTQEGSFVVCEKNLATAFRYAVPQNYSAETLSTMDQIVASFVWSGGVIK